MIDESLSVDLLNNYFW